MELHLTAADVRLQDDSTTVVPINTSFNEDSVSKIFFFVTFSDSAVDGPAGERQALYSVLDSSAFAGLPEACETLQQLQ